MINFLKNLIRCKHDFEKQEEVESGVTLGWDMRPTIQYSQTSVCSKCGAIETKTFIVHGHCRLWPERYGKDGWPITEDGERMKLADSVRPGT